MQITRMMCAKYYLLSVLGALVLAVGVLAVAPPSAQAQESPSIDKECTPNPVQIGQQITCTIDVEAAPGTGAFATVTDKLPAGLMVTEATFQSLGGIIAGPCAVADNTVTCPANGGLLIAPVEVTIEATAQQCGTFTNTATSEGLAFPANGGSARAYSITSKPIQITVVGCEEAGGGGAGGGGAGGGAAPITQDSSQDVQSGDATQTFDVS